MAEALTSSEIRRAWAAWECETSRYVRHPFPGDGRTWNLWVADAAQPAFARFTDLMEKHGYLFRESAGGTYNCRNVKLPSGATSVKSIHAYALAVDLNPSKNPYRKPLTHDYPAEFIADVEALRCANGRPVFQWGGRWGTPDAMHWQIACTPDEVRTIVSEEEEEEMPPQFTDEQAAWLAGFADQAIAAEARDTSFVHVLNFYREIADLIDYPGFDPVLVAQRLIDLIEDEGGLPVEEVVRIVRDGR